MANTSNSVLILTSNPTLTQTDIQYSTIDKNVTSLFTRYVLNSKFNQIVIILHFCECTFE